MKSIIRSSAVIVIAMVIVMSCKSEEENISNIAGIEFNGETYYPTVAYFTQYKYDNYPSTMYFTITDEVYPNPDKVDGTFYLQFELLSNYGEFALGNFKFDESLPRKEFTFNHAFIAINHGIEFDDNDPKFYALEGSEITISGEPYNYVIEFDLNLDNGKIFKGKYDGLFVDGE